MMEKIGQKQIPIKCDKLQEFKDLCEKEGWLQGRRVGMLIEEFLEKWQKNTQQ